MSSSRTKHVLHHGCVLATVLALSPLLTGCAQMNSMMDTQWLADISPSLAGETSDTEAALEAVVRDILPSGYNPTYGVGVDRAQLVRRPSSRLEWEGQIRSLAEVNSLGVTFEDKTVRIDRIASREVAEKAADSSDTASAVQPDEPKVRLVNATIMGMPRDQAGPVDAPAPLMTPQEAALLEQTQRASQSAPDTSPSAVLPVVLPSPKPQQDKREVSAEKLADIVAAALHKNEGPKADLVEATMMGNPHGSDTNPDAPSVPVVPHEAVIIPREADQSTEKETVLRSAGQVDTQHEPSNQPQGVVLIDSTVMGHPVGERVSIPAAIPVTSPQPQAVISAVSSAVTDLSSTATLSTGTPAAILVDETVMDVPRDAKSQAASPAPLMTPQEAADLARLQQASTVVATEAAMSAPEAVAVEPPVVSVQVPPPSDEGTVGVSAPIVLGQAEPENQHSSIGATSHAAAEMPKASVVVPKEAEVISGPSVPVAHASTLVPVVPVSEDASSSSSAPEEIVPVSEEARVAAAAPATSSDMTAVVGTVQGDVQSAPDSTAAVWRAERGDTLRGVLQKWCDRAGVQLNWSTDFDYPLQASVSINDSFENAVRTMLGGFTSASPQPYGRLHRQGNAGAKLLLIQTRGNRYED